MLLAAAGSLYVAALFLPRPMASLASADPDLVRIDFHSHTNRSKDARPSFSRERNRAWHQAGGYDVAYLTDHGAVAGDDPAEAARPRASVRLMPGIEVSWRGEHLGVLGTMPASRQLLSGNLHDLEPSRSGAAGKAPGPLIIWNHPRDPDLQSLPLDPTPLLPGLDAIEVSNGAPHAMGLLRQRRTALLALARRNGLPLVAGSDIHGWGRAAPNWTLLHVANWRALDRETLAARIAQGLREGGAGATHVVERRTADPGGSRTALALSVLIVPWRMLTTLSAVERLVWLAWIWGASLLVRSWRGQAPAGPH